MPFRFPPICLLILAMALTACSQSVDNDNLRVDVVSDDNRHLSVARLPLPRASGYLRAATAQGLVTFDIEGRVVPALASRWMVTEDGLTFVFRLRKTRWNDGTEVKADDIADALSGRIEELRRTGYSTELAPIRQVNRMTGRVLQIQLSSPMPNLLEYLALPQFGIVHRSAGSGPMLAEARADAMLLRHRGEETADGIALSEETILLRKASAVVALARMKTGSSDMATGGRFEHLPLLPAADLENTTLDPGNSLGLFGLRLRQAGPFLSERENREAIAMALNRPRMLTSFDDFVWQEQLTLVPEILEDRGDVPRPSWTALNMQERKTRAAAIIRNWERSNGEVRPLRIAMPRGPGARILFAWIRADLSAIGLDAEMHSDARGADFEFVDMVAPASTAAWYLDQLSCENSFLCDPDADALLLDGLAANSPAERKRLFGEAEVQLQQLRNYIPIAMPLRWTVYRNGLLGYSANPRGWHYLQNLGRDPT